MKSIFLLRLTTAATALVNANLLSAQTWTQTHAPLTNWNSIGCSADGAVVFAAGGGGFYRSTNSGLNWTQMGLPISTPASIACSADGIRVAAASGCLSYVSADSGLSWNPTSLPCGPWHSIAASANGTTLVTAGNEFPQAISAIAFSTNFGTDWNYTNYTGPWLSVSSSADGSRLLISGYWVVYQAGIWTKILASTNAGFTWDDRTPDSSAWTASVFSADGTKVTAVAKYGATGSAGGPIYVSTDFGATWTETLAPVLYWSAVAASADGTKLAAIGSDYYFSGPIYTSPDGGATWASNNAPVTNWTAIVSSADGNRLFAAMYNGGIYTAQTVPTPLLNLNQTEAGLTLSWIVPSINFVLQQNSDLTTSNWRDVPTMPTLNYTNLHYEITTATASRSMFYRLVSR